MALDLPSQLNDINDPQVVCVWHGLLLGLPHKMIDPRAKLISLSFYFTFIIGTFAKFSSVHLGSWKQQNTLGETSRFNHQKVGLIKRTGLCN